jgi:hypothetical protein
MLVAVEENSRRLVIESCGPCENKADVQQTVARHVETGATIWTDHGKAMLGAAEVINGTQQTVKHCEHFKDPKTGVHTNTVEGRNALLKSFLKRLGKSFAINDDVLWRYLSQYMFDQWFTNGTVTMQFAMFLIALYDWYGFV